MTDLCCSTEQSATSNGRGGPGAGKARRHEVLLRWAGAGIVGLGPRGAVTFANPEALRILRTTTADLVGRPICDELESCPVDTPELASSCPILSALDRGAAARRELELISPDHERIPVQAMCTPILDEELVTGAVMVFSAAQTPQNGIGLRASERRYRELVEYAPYGIYRTRTDGELLMANPALATILGYDSVSELLQINLREAYVDPEQRERLIHKYRDAEAIEEEDLLWRRKDGSVITVRVRGRPIRGGSGELAGWEVMVEDLTERRALEEQLRQSQKMEAVGQLTAGIAHDFNNLLAVILMASELLTESVEGGGSIDSHNLHVIQDAAERAQTVTQKLLRFSRHSNLVKEPTDLGRLVTDLSPMLAALVSEDVELEIEADAGLDTVLVDRGSVEQMIMNLVANARDATRAGGRIRVAVSQVEGSDDASPMPGSGAPFVTLEVADTGTGMDDDTLQKVFEPFFTTKQSASGTGLGMTMVYGLTQQHEGHIAVDSQIGEGTRIRIYLPAHEEATDRAVAPDTAVSDAPRPVTVLVVEDEENLRAVTQKALERDGHRVLTARDGIEAMRTFDRHQDEIDLVLSDLVLPGLGGIDLLERIREQHGAVKFVLASGYGAPDIDDRFAPEAPFLRKPWRITELRQAIRSALEDEPV
jgi:PAS domain S-box-containing protein